VKKIIVFYGIILAVLVVALRIIEYNYLMRNLTIEIYVGVIAVFFTFIGIWLGVKLINKPRPDILSSYENFEINRETLKSLGISEREKEVLWAMAQGLSNKEIAAKLFVSLNTIKTHSTNLYGKLNVSRRTQAIQKARNLNLIP